MTKTSSSSRFGLSQAAPAALWGLVLVLPAFHAAEAQEWRLEPEIRVGGEYDDNARLRANEADIFEIDGYIVEGSAGIAYQTQRSLFRITPTLRSRVYDEEIDVDSDDQFLDLEWTHETLKSQFALNGNYSRESARTAERADADIDVDDPDDIPIDETGVVFGNERRERFRISPKWRYEFTERMSFDTSFAYTDTSYEDNLLSPLSDYTDTRVNAGLGWQFSPRTRGYIAATARRFENELNTDVDGVGFGIGIESDISQTTRFRAEVGYEDSEQDGTGVSESNFVGDVNLVRKLETVTLLAQYRRDVTPGGSGRLTAKDSLNLSLKKQFTERVSGGLGVRAYQTDGLGDQAVTFEERDYAEVFVEFGVALSRAFSLEADYSYARVDESGTEGSADSNNIILWLVYRPTPIVSSR
ncbi:MAG: hypothetical protein WD795_05870 [Woeseia sp.]